MDIEFKPATIRGPRGTASTLDDLHAEDRNWLENVGEEFDEDADGRLLAGVPAGYDTVYCVGIYTITLD